MSAKTQKYDLVKIQSFYDLGNSQRDIAKEFGVAVMSWAIKNGLKCRSVEQLKEETLKRRPKCLFCGETIKNSNNKKFCCSEHY